MRLFSLYFTLGIEHIVSWHALDHILFVAALCLRYTFSNWKQLLILITAFTIGHSLTLILSGFNIINIPTNYSEFFIACTIVITALNNITVRSFQFPTKYPVIYFYALFFGLIHGMGFSTALKSLLGWNMNVTIPLLAFNIGIETGQIFIVTLLLCVSFLFINLLHCNRKEYILFVSGFITALAVQMCIERFPKTNLMNEHEKMAALSFNGANSGLPASTKH